MTPTFRYDVRKYALGTQVLPANITFYRQDEKKYAAPECGFLPFDIQLRFYTRIGKDGEPIGNYAMYFPANSVVRLTPKKGGLNPHYFEQVYLTGRNTFKAPIQSWVELPVDTVNERIIYLWIARINGQNKACVGFPNAKPRYVLHEIPLAKIPPMAVWQNGEHKTEPIMASQYYHGVYRFIDFCDSRFFSFEPIQLQAKKMLFKRDGATGEDGETPIDEEECEEVAKNVFVNVSGKTVLVEGWTTDNKDWDGEVNIRVIDAKTAKFENKRNYEEGERKYPNTTLIPYLSSDKVAGAIDDRRRGFINLPCKNWRA